MKDLKKYCVNELETIKEAVSVIQCNLTRCAIVINDQKKVVGVFSEGDVLRAILGNIDMHAPLKRVISPTFMHLLKPDINKAFDLVKKHGITLIPVIDDNFILKDVITIFDVLNKSSLKK